MAVNIVEQADDLVKIHHALISVSDKSGLEELVPGLVEVNPQIRIFSTGGTHARIQELLGDAAAKHLVAVSDYTGQPETQGGLVKTLDFKIYLGLLTERYNQAHRQDLARTGALPIDLVVVNLYPFTQTVAEVDVTPEKARANIDIGGPCMIRAAAKNYLRVAPVVDPGDYAGLLEKLRAAQGQLDLATRFTLARKAFAHTAAYDAAIAAYLGDAPVEIARGCYQLENPS
jgi:phosphoribosylaminoimidazolecarboxamide formyltransferase/IMP cyclohydrolase